MIAAKGIEDAQRSALVGGHLDEVTHLMEQRSIKDESGTGDVDAVTFTSSSTVNNFCDAVGPIDKPLRVISIGPVTSDSARVRGLAVDAEADPHTIDGLVDAVLAALS